MPFNKELYKQIAAAKLFIDGNFSEPIGLDRISREACMSRYHFHRMFRQIYRTTPHQYLTRKRIDRAKILLAENKPVQEVCAAVGFESCGSFSALFKKESGLAPQSYRQVNHLRIQEEKAEPARAIPHCFLQMSDCR